MTHRLAAILGIAVIKFIEKQQNVQSSPRGSFFCHALRCGAFLYDRYVILRSIVRFVVCRKFLAIHVVIAIELVAVLSHKRLKILSVS